MLRIVLKNTFLAAAVVGLDYILYAILCTISWKIVTSISFCIYKHIFYFPDVTFLDCMSAVISAACEEGVQFRFAEFGGSINTIFFWSGFAPSIWMWLYVGALFVTRLLLRSERILNWLRWFLDVEKTPFRSSGAVAAALAFIASAAILLVSAEVSRISAAA